MLLAEAGTASKALQAGTASTPWLCGAAEIQKPGTGLPTCEALISCWWRSIRRICPERNPGTLASQFFTTSIAKLVYQWIPPHSLLVATLSAPVDMSLRPAQSLLARSLRPYKPFLRSAPTWGRWQSNRASKIVGQRAKGSAWTTGRVLLLSAFVSSLTYVLGISDAGSHIDDLWSSNNKHLPPHYGGAKELDRVNSTYAGPC